MDHREFQTAHGDDARVIVGSWPANVTHDLFLRAIADATTHEDDQAFMQMLCPANPDESMHEVRERLARAEGISTKTHERREIRGAEAFIRRLDESLELLREMKDDGRTESFHEMDKEFILVALVRVFSRACR